MVQGCILITKFISINAFLLSFQGVRGSILHLATHLRLYAHADRSRHVHQSMLRLFNMWNTTKVINFPFSSLTFDNWLLERIMEFTYELIHSSLLSVIVIVVFIEMCDSRVYWDVLLRRYSERICFHDFRTLYTEEIKLKLHESTFWHVFWENWLNCTISTHLWVLQFSLSQVLYRTTS